MYLLVTKITVQLPRGLQARNTTTSVYKARSFSSDVILTKRNDSSNGKEIMKVMDLNVINGDEVTLYVNGVDEKISMDTLKNFLLNK